MQPTIEAYIFKEFATNDVWNRKQIHNYQKYEYNNDVELYSSHFTFAKALKEYVDRTGSVKGFNGLHFTDNIIFDFDGKKDGSNIEEVRREVIKFIQFLFYQYDVDIAYLKIYFSGSKGFHIYIPIELLGGIEPHRDFSKIVSLFSKRLTKGFKFVDPSIYDQFQLIRVPESKHGVTELYKTSLQFSELNNYSVEKIKMLAQSKRNIKEVVTDEISPNGLLAELFIESKKSITKQVIKIKRFSNAVDSENSKQKSVETVDKKLLKAIHFMQGRVEGYTDWISICYSLISLHFDKQVSKNFLKGSFRKISRNNSKYPNDTIAIIDNTFEECFESYNPKLISRIKIGTFYFIANRYGFKYQTQEEQLAIDGLHLKTYSEKFIKRVDISLQSKAIYLLLKMFADRDSKKAFPSYKLLEELTGIKRKAISKYIDELVDTGSIVKGQEKSDGGLFLHNTYLIKERVAEKI